MLAIKVTTLHTKETRRLQADILKKLLNSKIATKYRQLADELAATKNGEISTKSGQNTKTNLGRKR
jgi:hypothetical protein